MKKHIPNTITCCNLICGCIATFWAFQGDYMLALLFIILGAVFDFFDGMTARLLGVSSPIGKELDSLADVVTFGFAPSAMLFNFLCTIVPCSMAYIPYLAFIMAAFSALRLAKFNLDERQAMGFIGLPTPANALFWASLAAGWQWKTLFEPYPTAPAWVAAIVLAMMLVSCWLLVSEVPMFALKFKHWGWKGNEVKYLFLLTSAVLIVVLGTLGIAAVIAWYVLLSLLTQKRAKA
ncbi:MAG: CDP-diacylglycerol--serine O-phosphatidyltransferase [Prevotella sp.]|nr:CDP-diacylglycerol--serine O-phosphatidyltransferase [Prevotella sp.]